MGKKSASPGATAPSRQLTKLSQQIFTATEERAAFVQALQHPTPYPPAILWTRPRPQPLPSALTPLPPLAWQPPWVDRLPVGCRPGAHPLHQSGHFYCLDFSSIFAISVLGMVPAPVTTLVDLCAAPGGKSLYSWVALQPEMLLCNETVRKRVKILIANLKRCGAFSAQVFNLDPAVWAEQTPHSAQVVLVDAPCSGQSLLAKGETVPGCFHPVTINRNANRQKRILAHAAQLVAPGGYLVYTTCTYSPGENEQVGTWLMQRFPAFAPVAVPPLQGFQSPLTTMPCYRLWPQSALGAGAFALLLRHGGQAEETEGPRVMNQEFLARYRYQLVPPDCGA